MAFLKYRGSKPSSAWGADATGSQLTNTDIDTNFYSLDSAKFEKTGGTISGNVTISGDLTITGSNTIINTATLNVDDKNIELGAVDTPTNTTADGGGITLKGATDKTIIWDTTNANWTSSENWNLASGKTFKINNIDVLSSNRVQQLPYTSFLPNSLLISGYDRTSNVVTITTSSNHGFAVNDQVTIMYENTMGGFWGAVDVTITAVPTATTFRYTQTGINEASTSGGYVIKGSQNSFVLRDSVGDIRLGRYIYAQYFVGQWAGKVIPATGGGTGQISYSTGDILYASSATALTRLAKGTDGQVLKLSGGVPTWGTDIDTNTVTTIKGGTGTAVSGEVAFAAGTNVSITQSGQTITINSSYVDTNTDTTYSHAAATATGGANLGLTAGGSGSGTDNVLFQGEGGTTVSCVNADTIKISSTSVGDGALTVSAIAAADSGSSITLALSGAYSANSSTARSLDLKVGPALSALATLMSTAGAGFIRRGATADTYTIDTNSYLTSYTETDTLATVTGRANGSSTNTLCNFNGGLNVDYLKLLSIGGATSGQSSHFRRTSDDDVSYVWGAAVAAQPSQAYIINQTDTYATRFVTGLTQGYSNGRSHSFQRGNQYSSVDSISWVDLMYIKHDGSVWAKGDVIAYSDSRVKGNVKTIDNALDKVEQLRGVTYERTDLENKKSLGVIAQEVKEVFPELVSEDQDGMLSVAYGNMVGVLIQAIKELNAKVEDLQKQIANK